MYSKRRLVKAIKILSRRFSKFSKKYLTVINKPINWLLRTLFITQRRRESANAGFVLPTVAMVALVVVLLTTAILFRSFDRSKNASNVRVNQAVLNAAAPAIDRARAKLNKLFEPGSGGLGAIPVDKTIEDKLTLNGKINEYTFGDETQLQLTLGKEDPMKTAWLYPVDTDNNGKFDSYTIYGIYFKNPHATNGKFDRGRNSLEARTPPMISGNVSSDCGDTLGTSATLVGGTGWFNIAGKLKKSFFVYTATVPITTDQTGNYERYKGNKGFSAIEYQQDRVQLPLVNNAVVYDDDIELTPGTDFKLNGRIFTNSNFLTGGISANGITLYQVSSKDSCFYEDDNAKIIIGGNLSNGSFTNIDKFSGSTKLDLFPGKGKAPSTTQNVKLNTSVTEFPANVAYNSQAYVKRINFLVDAQIASGKDDPDLVKDGITKQKKSLGLSTFTTDEEAKIRRDQLEGYFKQRTRRVPYAEVLFNGDAIGSLTTANVLEGQGNELRPTNAWMYPTDPDDGTTGSGYALLTLNSNSKKLIPGATEPKTLQTKGAEQSLGDRILIGNNLPEIWWDKNKGSGEFVGPDPQDTQNIKDTEWNLGPGTRTRRTRVEQLADLGATDRNGDWELAAAQIPANVEDPVGGLRVVTGAGIYLPSNLTVSSGAAAFTTAITATDKIWSDMMPVPSETATIGNATDNRDVAGGFDYTTVQLTDPTNTAYLRMRATAVYHYKTTGYDAKAPKPIACVSSYYDPTTSQTATNQKNLPDIKNRDGASKPEDRILSLTDKVLLLPGNSNNGVVYKAPNKAASDYKAVLDYQALLKYPNGRWVNEPLKNALAKDAANLTLSERSTIDSALCSLQILDKTIGDPTDSVIPHGAIKETAFLDARQIKAIHTDVTTGVETFTNADGYCKNAKDPCTLVNLVKADSTALKDAKYDLPIEQRQPLEIRATVLDIDLLRRQKIGDTTPAQEYLVPNSGIIYATRDDALLDLSAKLEGGLEIQKRESRVDFILDPTRRPNAIMMIYGDKIWREKDYRQAEKGLILASNLPVYIKGTFNRHTQQEFTEALADTWSNFYTRTKDKLNVNFACRNGDTRLPKCTVGDEWRPASVLADAITLLSNNFRFGFRNEGDYDLNNNLGNNDSIGKFRKNGFFTNAYVTNAQWYDSDGYPKDLDTDSIKGEDGKDETFQGSSYLNNFATPIQRRTNFHEYLMEICPKLPVSECQGGDWWVTIAKAPNPGIKASDIIGKPFALSIYKAGTTAQSPTDLEYLRYPRRVAFKRDASNKPVLVSGKSILLGIDGTVKEYVSDSSTQPPTVPNALWFQTTPDNSNNKPITGSDKLKVTSTLDQPLLQPVLQIKQPFDTSATPSSLKVGDNKDEALNPRWLQRATETTFNLAAAAGDSPARPTEDNGGLQNFVRFTENWNPTGLPADSIKARISGSFIQFKRSAYATSPFWGVTNGSYGIQGSSSNVPYYMAPTRQWGYDVGLLSQSPDLFAQKLVRTPDDLPDEFFREVGRDDAWVQTLLCAKGSDGKPVLDADQRPSNTDCNK